METIFFNKYIKNNFNLLKRVLEQGMGTLTDNSIYYNSIV